MAGPTVAGMDESAEHEAVEVGCLPPDNPFRDATGRERGRLVYADRWATMLTVGERTALDGAWVQLLLDEELCAVASRLSGEELLVEVACWLGALPSGPGDIESLLDRLGSEEDLLDDVLAWLTDSLVQDVQSPGRDVMSPHHNCIIIDD
jgi:hypothetical protein